MQINPSQVSQIIEVRRGDDARIFGEQLLIGTTPINLSGSSVTLVLHDPSTSTTTRRTATVTSAVSGSVQYQFVEADVETAGTKLMEWEIINSAGKELTIPTTGYYVLDIINDLQ
jgi:hypothetical protein